MVKQFHYFALCFPIKFLLMTKASTLPARKEGGKLEKKKKKKKKIMSLCNSSDLSLASS
jgi:hypothetical protein